MVARNEETSDHCDFVKKCNVLFSHGYEQDMHNCSVKHHLMYNLSFTFSYTALAGNVKMFGFSCMYKNWLRWYFSSYDLCTEKQSSKQ